MAKTKQPDYYIARESFWYNGQFINAGQTRVHKSDPLLKTHSGAFEPISASRGFSDVEQATAAPGERRRVSLTTTPEGAADDGEA